MAGPLFALDIVDAEVLLLPEHGGAREQNNWEADDDPVSHRCRKWPDGKSTGEPGQARSTSRLRSPLPSCGGAPGPSPGGRRRRPARAAEQLEGHTRHGNRHTFASRLVMAGVDLRTVQQLGGWQSSGRVQRSSHLGPDHLLAAAERLVSSSDRAALGPV